MTTRTSRTFARTAAIASAVLLAGMALTACSGGSSVNEKTGAMPEALQGTWSCSSNGTKGKVYDIPGSDSSIVGGAPSSSVVISKDGNVTSGTLPGAVANANPNVSAAAWAAFVGHRGGLNVKPFGSLTTDAKTYNAKIGGTTPATFSVSASKITLTLTKDNVTSTCTR